MYFFILKSSFKLEYNSNKRATFSLSDTFWQVGSIIIRLIIQSAFWREDLVADD